MKLDLSELMSGRASSIRFDYTFDPEHVDLECAALPSDVTIPENGIRVTGDAVDSLGFLKFRAHVSVAYLTQCARCLDEIKEEFDFDMERMILTAPAEEKNHVNADGEWDGVLDDTLTVNEGRLIPDADIIEEISLGLPPFALCSPDCPGLCPKCGKRRADGDCGCRDEKFVNPKFAVLKSLLKDGEESERG
ncbi:MAG: DUF177 domain-containing protein [Clostridia bacterium]|nr:DUF177 domain-containing protein [Clostridia bacterium]